MALNLSGLNISLDTFNKEASGEYNIGQMKLSSDGKSVYRTNSHKTWTILNRTKMSSEEALAVKFAFCKALSNEGLSDEAINAVKAKLGIPGNATDALKAGNIKPLTAAEVREVIDKYAGDINRSRASAAKGANAAKLLKTSADFYRGVSQKEMLDRAATRTEINTRSIGKMMTGTDKSVNTLLDILQFGEKNASSTPAEKRLAREMMTKLSNPTAFDVLHKTVNMESAPVTFVLQENGKVAAKFRLGNGNSFAIDTGLDRNGLVDKAVNVLNAAAAAMPPRVENPRVEKNKADDEIMDAINELESGGIEPERKDRTMSKVDLLNGIGIVFDALKKARGPGERKTLREANMEDVVKALLQALNKVRKLDNRNTELVNNVREVFYGNPEIKSDDVLKEISDVLNEKSADPFKKVEENIMNHAEDDLDGNFNINNFLNGN